MGINEKKLTELKRTTELLIRDAESKVKLLNTLNASIKPKLEKLKKEQEDVKKKRDEVAQKEKDLKYARLRLLKILKENRLDEDTRQLMLHELKRSQNV